MFLQLTVSEWPPTCLGPLRLAGHMDTRWLSVTARIYLRGLCKKAQSLMASFGKGESDRSVMLYDQNKCCLNDKFAEYIKASR
ncbi:unnamed protein product [Gongylonema pulchrum]|uniref:Uncharacterized protein n=1 Tax=Gongylonema pulchrum TaxID=637853 RepID=A0A183EHI0_9BILA|nr:unnamed protein product [Gongylonema pulchrum]